MLMRPHDGAVDHGVLVVGILGQVGEYRFPDSTSAPAHMARVNHPEIPEPFGQIPPGNAGSIAVDHRLDKPPVVLRRDAHPAFAARQQVLNPLPLIVSQRIAFHQFSVPYAPYQSTHYKVHSIISGSYFAQLMTRPRLPAEVL